MFYEPGKTSHNLPRDPYKSCVVPRPIGWISTVSAAGKPNLAPYSQFNNLTFSPPYVMFSANQNEQGSRKDTVNNAEATGVFCWQMATWDLREYVNASAETVPEDVDEFEHVKLEKTYSKIVRTKDPQKPRKEGPQIPMVARSPIKFECLYHTTLRLPADPPIGTVDVVIGRVIGVHISEDVLTDGKVDLSKAKPIARCGYFEYAVVEETFEMIVPNSSARGNYGLEGNPRANNDDEDEEEK